MPAEWTGFLDLSLIGSSTGDFKAALRACTFVRDLKSGLDSAQPYVRDLGKKQSITEQSLLKIEKSEYLADRGGQEKAVYDVNAPCILCSLDVIV